MSTTQSQVQTLNDPLAAFLDQPAPRFAPPPPSQHPTAMLQQRPVMNMNGMNGMNLGQHFPQQPAPPQQHMGLPVGAGGPMNMPPMGIPGPSHMYNLPATMGQQPRPRMALPAGVGVGGGAPGMPAQMQGMTMPMTAMSAMNMSNGIPQQRRVVSQPSGNMGMHPNQGQVQPGMTALGAMGGLTPQQPSQPGLPGMGGLSQQQMQQQRQQMYRMMQQQQQQHQQQQQQHPQGHPQQPGQQPQPQHQPHQQPQPGQMPAHGLAGDPMGMLAGGQRHMQPGGAHGGVPPMGMGPQSMLRAPPPQTPVMNTLAQPHNPNAGMSGAQPPPSHSGFPGNPMANAIAPSPRPPTQPPMGAPGSAPPRLPSDFMPSFPDQHHPQHPQHPQHLQHPQQPQHAPHPQHPQHSQHPQHPQHSQHPQHPQHHPQHPQHVPHPPSSAPPVQRMPPQFGASFAGSPLPDGVGSPGPSSMQNLAGSSRPSSFQMTPAQAEQHLQFGAGERPPSHPQQTSPPPRPPSRRTPMMAHAQTPQPQMQPPSAGHSPPAVDHGTPGSTGSSAGTRGGALSQAAIAAANNNMVTYPIGLGQGLMRLLNFSNVLAADSKSKLHLSHWQSVVRDTFTPTAIFKLTLWKDNQRLEAKPFEIGVPIMPRFFLVTHQSGVKYMNLALDGARERLLAQGHAVVECLTAVWTYTYHNGYVITLRGPLTAHIVVQPHAHPPPPGQTPFMLKLENLQFDCDRYDKHVNLDHVLGQRMQEPPRTPRMRNPATPKPAVRDPRYPEEDAQRMLGEEEPRVIIERASIPGDPVNAFGIPQATMRCLELAESVGQMSDLIQYSTKEHLGPLDALKQFATTLRVTGPPLLPGHPPHAGPSSGPLGGGLGPPPGAIPPPSMLPPHFPANATSPAAPGSPQKQPKAAPSTPQTPATAVGTPTLKRKAAGDAQAAAPEPQPAAKRPARKRGKTGG